MKLLGRILALFLIMPVVELALLVQVDKLIGFWPTIGVIVATGVAGSFLARREGLSVWRRLNERLNQGGLPGNELLDGVIILVAGALLITPGVLTDVVGFLGLIPLTRRGIRKLVQKRIKRSMREGKVTFVGFDGWTEGSYGPHGMPEANEYWGGTPKESPNHARVMDTGDEDRPPSA